MDPAGCVPESVAWGTVGWLVTGDLLWTNTPLHQLENSTLPPPAGMQHTNTLCKTRLQTAWLTQRVVTIVKRLLFIHIPGGG